jgi:hypothetical protein
MHYYTYAYLREDRTPYYIGKGKEGRIYSKQKNIKPPKDKSRIIFLKKNLTEEEAFRHEIYMMDVFGRKDLGTGILHNRTDGGEGSSGCIRSDETRRKLSEAGKGKTLSKEHRRKLSEASKGEKNHNYGKPKSEETRRKLSEAKKGKTASEESRKKMSESGKVKTISEEHRRKMTEATQSKETRRKMSESGKVKIFSEEHRRNLSQWQIGKTLSEETRRKISEAAKGKKWWNDGCGNRKFVLECPGDGWKSGMK